MPFQVNSSSPTANTTRYEWSGLIGCSMKMLAGDRRQRMKTCFRFRSLFLMKIKSIELVFSQLYLLRLCSASRHCVDPISTNNTLSPSLAYRANRGWDKAECRDGWSCLSSFIILRLRAASRAHVVERWWRHCVPIPSPPSTRSRCRNSNTSFASHFSEAPLVCRAPLDEARVLVSEKRLTSGAAFILFVVVVIVYMQRGTYF